MSTDTEIFVVGGPDVAWRETGGEIVVLDHVGAVYFGLNGTGAQLWKRLIDGATRADLVEHLSRRPNAADARLPTDIDRFLTDLDRHGLLRRAPAQPAVSPHSSDNPTA